MGDCGKWCKDKICDRDYPLLFGEPPTDRPILSRSYPVFSDDWCDLYVDVRCPLHGWLSKGFVKRIKEVWAELWGYPEIRLRLPKVLTNEATLLDSVKHNFDDSYKWAMQSQYRTIYPDLKPYIGDNDCVLDVGCGDGRLVRELRERGVIDTFGVEVNEAWIDETPGIWRGDVEKRLPFDDGQFTVVISIDVLEHLEDPLKGLSEMFRVSRDRVIAFITPVEAADFWQDPTHKVEWGIERWKRELNEFGEITDFINPCGFVVRKNAD